jgi:hypothetical protein
VRLRAALLQPAESPRSVGYLAVRRADGRLALPSLGRAVYRAQHRVVSGREADLSAPRSVQAS